MLPCGHIGDVESWSGTDSIVAACVICGRVAAYLPGDSGAPRFLGGEG